MREQKEEFLANFIDIECVREIEKRERMRNRQRKCERKNV